MYVDQVNRLGNYKTRNFLNYPKTLKSRRLRRAGHVVMMGMGGMHIAFWSGNLLKMSTWESEKDAGG
jgi:hypothetical protein